MKTLFFTIAVTTLLLISGCNTDDETDTDLSDNAEAAISNEQSLSLVLDPLETNSPQTAVLFQYDDRAAVAGVSH